MERETILFDVADNVATITLNRPDSLNSFNEAMAKDMTWAWETVRDTDDIHCVVLQANGERAFSTGIDIKAGGDWFTLDNVWNSFDPGMALAPKFKHRVWKPVVTAVHGMAAGGAQYFLNESDIIICSEDAVFFDPHASVGIVSALEPIGMLHRGIPLGDVLRWALMGNEERITAETALRIGLVTRDRAARAAPRPGPGDRDVDRAAQPQGDPGHGAGHMGIARYATPDSDPKRALLHADRQPRAGRRTHRRREKGDAVSLGPVWRGVGQRAKRRMWPASTRGRSLCTAWPAPSTTTTSSEGRRGASLRRPRRVRTVRVRRARTASGA